MTNKWERFMYYLISGLGMILKYLVITLIAYIFIILVINQISPEIVSTYMKITVGGMSVIDKLFMMQTLVRPFLIYPILVLLIISLIRTIYLFYIHLPKTKTLGYSLMIIFIGYFTIPLIAIFDDEVEMDPFLKRRIRLTFRLYVLILAASLSYFIGAVFNDLIAVLHSITTNQYK